MSDVAAKEDLSAKLATEYDLELLQVGMQAIRSRVHPDTWRAFELLELQGQTGQLAASNLKTSVVNVYKARSNVRRLLREWLNQADSGGL